jgi:hypothetical protein
MVCGPTCVSLGKMLSLNRELRLVKGALEQLCGCFELLLAEMDEMQSTDEAKSAHAALCERSLFPLPDREIVRERVKEDAVDAGAPSYTDDAALAPGADEEDFWAALRAAVAEAPALEEPAEIPAGTACDRLLKAIGRPTIDPAAEREPASHAELPAAAGSADLAAAAATSPADAADGVVAAAAEMAGEMVGATPAPIYVIAYRQPRRQPRPLSRYAALAALIATIVMALVGIGVTRGFADLLPRIDAEARPS